MGDREWFEGNFGGLTGDFVPLTCVAGVDVFIDVVAEGGEEKITRDG